MLAPKKVLDLFLFALIYLVYLFFFHESSPLDSESFLLSINESVQASRDFLTQLKPSAGTRGTRFPRSATIQEMQLNNLVPGEIYNISVSAVSAAGIGPLTSELVAR